MGIGASIVPVLAVLLMAGLASSFLQHAPRIVFDRIQPDWNRISLINGWHRLFSARGQADFFKGVCKLLSIGIVIWTVFQSQRSAFIDTMSLDPDAVPELILTIAMRLLMAVCVVTILLLAVDLLWVRMHWRKDIRMSKQEIKDEMKELEGDPLKKARLRSLALDRRRRSMIAAVPRATLVIANPTHYAIALRYVREEGGAPLVLSKGKDLIALKIREIAEQHLIPIIEDKLLASSMYDSVEVVGKVRASHMLLGRREDHVELLANALGAAVESVAAELRLIDAGEFIAFIYDEKFAKIQDIVNSSVELFFRPGAVSFGWGVEYELDWNSSPVISLDMEFRHGSVRLVSNSFCGRCKRK